MSERNSEKDEAATDKIQVSSKTEDTEGAGDDQVVVDEDDDQNLQFLTEKYSTALDGEKKRKHGRRIKESGGEEDLDASFKEKKHHKKKARKLGKVKPSELIEISDGAVCHQFNSLRMFAVTKTMMVLAAKHFIEISSVPVDPPGAAPNGGSQNNMEVSSNAGDKSDDADDDDEEEIDEDVEEEEDTESIEKPEKQLALEPSCDVCIKIWHGHEDEHIQKASMEEIILRKGRKRGLTGLPKIFHAGTTVSRFPALVLDSLGIPLNEVPREHPTRFIQKVVHEVSQTIHELATLGFLHHNVKPNNIIHKEESNAIVLVDFSNSIRLNDDTLVHSSDHRTSPVFAPSAELLMYDKPSVLDDLESLLYGATFLWGDGSRSFRQSMDNFRDLLKYREEDWEKFLSVMDTRVKILDDVIKNSPLTRYCDKTIQQLFNDALDRAQKAIQFANAVNPLESSPSSSL